MPTGARKVREEEKGKAERKKKGGRAQTERKLTSEMTAPAPTTAPR